MNGWSVNLFTVSRADLACATCGHAEQDHVLEDVPLALEKRSLCTECEDWHAFTPTQQS